MEWLARPIVANGVVVAGPLDPARLTDADLRSICVRMHAILDTVDMPRCEGRLIPTKLFDAIDTLQSMVVNGLPSPTGQPTQPRLAEWADTVREFGVYYGLAGARPIAVDLEYWRAALAWLGAAQDAEPRAAGDTAGACRLFVTCSSLGPRRC